MQISDKALCIFSKAHRVYTTNEKVAMYVYVWVFVCYTCEYHLYMHIFLHMPFHQSLMVLSASWFFVLFIVIYIYIVLWSGMRKYTSNRKNLWWIILIKVIVLLLFLVYKLIKCCTKNDKNEETRYQIANDSC